MGPFLAVLAAVAFAVGTVLQQKGTLSTDAGEGDPRFLIQILHQPVWLGGMICQAAGWILQALALDRASLVVVQALVSLSLVIALPLGAWLTHQYIGRREITGAVLILAGITFFVSAGQPQGGTNSPAADVWWTACALTFGLMGVLAAAGGRLRGAEKALALGAAAGLGYGLQAAVTKTFVTELGGGVLGLLGSWSTYVLIVSAVAGFALQQSALKTGVLAPAMASANSVTLFSSVILGIVVYGERLSKANGAHTVLAFIGLGVAIAGIVFLARPSELPGLPVSEPPAPSSPPPSPSAEGRPAGSTP